MPILSNNNFEKNYALSYYVNSIEDELKMAQARFNRIIRFRNQVGRILDIGCGRGAFLTVCMGHNGEAYGLDVSKDSIEYARRNGLSNLFLGELKDAEFRDNYFDIIVANSVLEHVSDPCGFLKEIWRILKGNGLLYIGVPNEGSAVYTLSDYYFKIAGSKWTSHLAPLFPPYHLYGFSKETLTKMLMKAGFSVFFTESYSSHDAAIGFKNYCISLIRKQILKIENKIGSGDILLAYAAKKWGRTGG
jgi:2-polyprenyl-3-methyl-5-hydroxy-6-metoxy-1,4-benzoquinol methylase